MKKSIIDDLTNIINEIEYYKSKKDLIRFMIRLDNLINDNKKDVIKEMLNDLIAKINSNPLNDDIVKTIEKVIWGFLLRNEKQYIDKKDTIEYIVYEYRSYYSIYIKKCDDINKLLKEKFPDKKIKSIVIDNVKWNNIINISTEDIKRAKTIKVDVEK